MSARPMSSPRAADAATRALRWILAALSFGGAALHLVMVPQHAQESLRAGLAFAAVGWFQAAVGVAVLLTSRRAWLWAAVAGNAVFVAVWLLSRTAGLPSWTGDGGVEAAHAADVVCVVFEVAIVAVALLVLASPRFLEHWTREAVPAAVVVAVVVLVGTTAVLAAPSTAGHSHDDAVTAAAGHTHGAVHTHDAAPAASSESASVAASAHVDRDTGSAAASAATPHVHAESTITYDELPPATRDEVDQVRAIWADKYATAADAMQDGWFRATRNLYGIGAHYVRISGFGAARTFDLLNPNILLFDGEGPDAKFAGVSYIVTSPPPAGFAGDFDVWHSHKSVCTQGGTIISLSEDNSPVWLSESECTERGGHVLPLASDEMIHVWIGPEYIDSAPIFAHDHPKLLDGYNPKRDV